MRGYPWPGAAVSLATLTDVTLISMSERVG